MTDSRCRRGRDARRAAGRAADRHGLRAVRADASSEEPVASPLRAQGPRGQRSRSRARRRDRRHPARVRARSCAVGRAIVARCCPARTRSSSRTRRGAFRWLTGATPTRSASAFPSSRRAPRRRARRASAPSPRRARTCPAGRIRDGSTRCREDIRDGVRPPDRRRRAAGHAVDRDRPHRRRSRGSCARAPLAVPAEALRRPGRRQYDQAGPREGAAHGRRAADLRAADDRGARRDRPGDRRRCSAASSSGSATRSS